MSESKEFRKAMLLFERYMDSRDRSDRTIIGYRRDLTMVENYLKNRYGSRIYVHDVTTNDIEDYLLMLKVEKQYKASSRNRHIGALKSFYKFCQREGWASASPLEQIEKIRGPQKEREILEFSEVNTFITAIDHPLIRVVAQCLYYTGLRISECLGLRYEDVNLERRRIWVSAGKGNKSRSVPINERLLFILADYLDVQTDSGSSEYFFATKKSGQLSNVYVNRILDRTRVKLGWRKRVSAHTFRHSFASHLVRKGVNIADIQKILGHSDLKTTSVYLHTDQDSLLASVDLL
ncbi:integrase [Geomicrobium sp. JCM 19037]|uniref:tyrosine-type recombinase/integrase n=1 Tax=Geomicrobium sp. JCM 19037 TaxID=1460634 RepID=UPI00045F22B9|nr:tyrosine-type recombinase/integrase [Geomicrobium sp. JCM 19037]GAK02976.1 integrase [Geomicrobium sp. JCM 19037]